MKKNILTGIAFLAGVSLGYGAKAYSKEIQALAEMVKSRITALFSSKNSTTVNAESEEPSVEEK